LDKSGEEFYPSFHVKISRLVQFNGQEWEQHKMERTVERLRQGKASGRHSDTARDPGSPDQVRSGQVRPPPALRRGEPEHANEAVYREDKYTKYRAQRGLTAGAGGLPGSDVLTVQGPDSLSVSPLAIDRGENG